MKRTFLVFCLLVYSCFVLPVAAQDTVYTVTERELSELESILMSFQENRQMQHSQVLILQDRLNTAHERAKNLQATLSKAEAKAKDLQKSLQKAEVQVKDLNSQLQAERKALTALRQSYNVYEAETAQAIQAKQTDIDRLKTKLYRRTIVLVILSALLTVSVLFTAFKWYLRGRLHLFPP